MQKFQKFLNVTVLATEASHVFCCVLPTVFSLLSLLAGIGLIGAIPPGVEFLHDIIHNWELPIIAVSGLVLMLGWWVHDYAQKMDCKSMGTDHAVCGSRKKKSAKILKVATALFILNVSVFFLIHRPMDQHNHEGHEHPAHEAEIGAAVHESHDEHGHDKHHGHDH